MNLQISLASLVRTNNGLFKSEKQRDFIISKIKDDGMVFEYSTSVYNHHCRMSYICDETGVIKVSKYTYSKGDVVIWTRPSAGELCKADAAIYKRCLKSKTQIETEIETALNGLDFNIAIELAESVSNKEKERIQAHDDFAAFTQTRLDIVKQLVTPGADIAAVKAKYSELEDIGDNLWIKKEALDKEVPELANEISKALNMNVWTFIYKVEKLNYANTAIKKLDEKRNSY